MIDPFRQLFVYSLIILRKNYTTRQQRQTNSQSANPCLWRAGTAPWRHRNATTEVRRSQWDRGGAGSELSLSGTPTGHGQLEMCQELSLFLLLSMALIIEQVKKQNTKSISQKAPGCCVAAGQSTAGLSAALPFAFACEWGCARAGFPPPRESPPGPHLKAL